MCAYSAPAASDTAVSNSTTTGAHAPRPRRAADASRLRRRPQRLIIPLRATHEAMQRVELPVFLRHPETSMKRLSALLLLSIVLASCGGGEATTTGWTPTGRLLTA